MALLGRMPHHTTLGPQVCVDGKAVSAVRECNDPAETFAPFKGCPLLPL
jgi:hypothetical protein